MIEGAAVFGVFAVVGLVAAKRPQIFVRYFLAEWQRQRLAGNESVVSSVGWLIFAASACVVFALLMSILLRHP